MSPSPTMPTTCQLKRACIQGLGPCHGSPCHRGNAPSRPHAASFLPLGSPGRRPGLGRPRVGLDCQDMALRHLAVSHVATPLRLKADWKCFLWPHTESSATESVEYAGTSSAFDQVNFIGPKHSPRRYPVLCRPADVPSCPKTIDNDAKPA